MTKTRAFAVAFGWFALGLLTVPALTLLYLRAGVPPVAVADPALPFEQAIVHVPLHARIDREMPAASPFAESEHSDVAGAAVYRQQCASCHGIPGKASSFASHMYPSAPQLWKTHRAGVVGVSDDPVGATYWRVKNGIRLSGMPAYADVLSEEQMWQVSMLLAAAAKPISPAVQSALAGN